ncbi:hypothetical protein Ptc2401_01234 [Prosthecochloris sp. CIB 2401]|nr:hypothetical protein Ptc2401_01234 [Prosthecochloris sp. CIB 2401]
MQHTGIRTLLFMFMLIGFSASAAMAMDIDTARQQGLAGETDSGYLAVPPNAAGDAMPIITTVNEQRRAEYTRIATRNGIAAEVVGTMMFEKIYPTLAPGTWVRINGSWSQK